jgi:aspartate aminotransferase
MALDARVKELKRQGADIITFGVGEPDFDTPGHIKAKAAEAISRGFTKYTPNAGIPELRETIARKFQEENGIACQPSQVLVSSGCKHSLYNAVQVLVDEGDEVLCPAPCWVSYKEMVRLAGGIPILVLAGEDQGFKVAPETLERFTTPRTKAVLLNTPGNPTGAVYSRQELEDLASFVLERDLYVISDEVYEKLIYGGKEHVSIASLGPEVKKRTVTVNGVSKAFSMTGWRIGYTTAEPGIIKAMDSIQSQMTSCACSISQMAALAALAGPTEPVRDMVAEFEKRRDYMAQRLQSIPGFSLGQVPDGAFYLFPRISELHGRRIGGRTVEGAASLAEVLLEAARVAVVPGEDFGSAENVRLSYATSMEAIAEGLDRVEEALGKED